MTGRSSRSTRTRSASLPIAARGRRPRGRRAAARLRRRARPPAVGRRRARRPAGPRRDDGGRGRRRRTPVGRRSTRTLAWVQRRPLRPDAGPRRPVRRAAGWTPRSPDRPVVLQATDHHCAWVNTEAPAPRRHRRATPPTRRRRDRAARRRQPAGHAGRVDRDGPGAAARAAPDRRGAGETGWPGRPRCSPRPASPGSQEAALAPADVAGLPRHAGRAGRLPVRANIALRAEPDGWPPAARRVRWPPGTRRRVSRWPTRCRRAP